MAMPPHSADAFETLVLEHHAQLRAFIRALGVDPEWVDDLAQEAFLVAYRELEGFDAGRDFGKWLRGIARNLVRNEIRKDARRRRIMSEHLTTALLEGDESPTPLEESRLTALRDCVEQLPKKSRELVAGRYRDGWKSSELAEHAGMTAAAIRQALTRIRGQLKQCIEHQAAGV